MVTGSLSPTRGARGRVTLQIIADMLDVSTATVSLALRNAPVVADATRLRVQQAARELGYTYNRSAAALRTSRSDMIAVGLNDVSQPDAARILAVVEDAARDAGRTILLGTYAESLDRQERVLGMLREFRPDGMLICPASGSTAEALAHLVDAGIPVVLVQRDVDGAGFDYVGVDDGAGAELAVDHLVALGHRRIGMIGGDPMISSDRARRAGFLAAMAARGLPVDPDHLVDGYGTRETGIDGTVTILSQDDPPTAIVCVNDLVAFGAMVGLARTGRRPGVDVSIVGCGDAPEAAASAPGLTTVRTHHDAVGRRAAEVLMRRIADPDAAPERHVFAPELVARATTAAH